MLNELNNYPKIRFNGFSDLWHIVKLGDILQERNVLQPQSDIYPLVSFTIEDGVTPKTDRYDRESLVQGDKFAKKYRQTKLNDIVYNPANLKFGAISRNKYGDAVFSPIYVTFEVVETSDSRFIEKTVTKKDFILQALTYQQGTVYERMSVSPEDLCKLNINIPNKQEQSRIGTFFSSLDNLIDLSDKRIKSLKAIKSSLLSKLFCEGANLKPSIRFKGFEDAWEEKKLGNLAEIYDGVHQTPNYTSSGIMFLSVEDINSLKSEKYISENDFKRNYKVYPQKNDILMTRIGDVGTPNIVKNNNLVAYYVSLALIKPLNINPYYLNYVIQSKHFQKGLKERTLLTAIPQKINKDEIGKILTIYPSIDEQAKIGQFFMKLDDLITLETKKSEKLRNIKSSLLNSMFC